MHGVQSCILTAKKFSRAPAIYGIFDKYFELIDIFLQLFNTLTMICCCDITLFTQVVNILMNIYKQYAADFLLFWCKI
jgi:hypothetical protein